ncbi:hypothetical protein IEQ34_022428 [Dendrobium chrysotoxum]|uniref:Uncharacterized protein n=1 Tax=Dendrobium chrysotoxum TaxID=161865 RepID=A0AAV7FYZ9_DENCH|nr:hypothetical protein IEQ34_022428 [Dendrobium chrysotoxum]
MQYETFGSGIMSMKMQAETISLVDFSGVGDGHTLNMKAFKEVIYQSEHLNRPVSRFSTFPPESGSLKRLISLAKDAVIRATWRRSCRPVAQDRVVAVAQGCHRCRPAAIPQLLPTLPPPLKPANERRPKSQRVLACRCRPVCEQPLPLPACLRAEGSCRPSLAGRATRTGRVRVDNSDQFAKSGRLEEGRDVVGIVDGREQGRFGRGDWRLESSRKAEERIECQRLRFLGLLTTREMALSRRSMRERTFSSPSQRDG